MNRRPWTKAEDELLTAIYATTLTKAIAITLGRSLSSTHQRARALGLHKSEEWIAATAKARTDNNPHHGSRATRLLPGSKPWNLGVKGSTGTHENCRATQFKAGRKPEEAANYKPIGSLRMSKDGYLERKVSDDSQLAPARRWVSAHRLVWEQGFGPVPDGHIVVFKPGMKTTQIDEITADRLECISRAENMRRNTYHRYGKEIAALIHLRGVLNRQINKRSRKEAA